jgi:hypothetical protein
VNAVTALVDKPFTHVANRVSAKNALHIRMKDGTLMDVNRVSSHALKRAVVRITV